MTQLFCDDVRLDLFEGTKFDFQKTNAIFAFDNLQMERSTSFDLPATATNNSVFAFCGKAWTDGNEMRKKHTAQLQISYIVKKGYLYITAFENGKYKAVFVCGELLPLFDIKNAGNIADFVSDSVVIGWSDAQAIARPTTLLQGTADLAYRLNYHSNISELLPGYALGKILLKIKNNKGWAVQLPSDVWKVYAVLSNLKSANITSARMKSNASATKETTSPQLVNSLDLGALGYVVKATERHVGLKQSNPDTYKYKYGIFVFEALQDLQITFPSSLSDSFFLLDFPHSDTSPEYFFENPPTDFYGDYYFTVVEPTTGQQLPTKYTISGTPLKGRTVEIKAGQNFTLFNMNYYEKRNVLTSGSWHTIQGYNLQSGAAGYNVALSSVDTGDIYYGNYIRLKDNLPEITYIDALKAIANLYGRFLNYENGKGITFETLDDLYEWPTKDITGRTFAGYTLERNFADYAQNNYVYFDSNEAVANSDKLKIKYTIKNDLLDADKDIYIIPFSEGARFDASDVYIKAEREEKDGKITATNGDKDTLTIAGPGTSTYVDRVKLPINNVFEEIVQKSTKVVVSVKMTLAEFDQMSNKMLILYEGVRYVWTGATWSEGTAKLTLARILL